MAGDPADLRRGQEEAAARQRPPAVETVAADAPYRGSQFSPVVPAQAGTQGDHIEDALDPRFRGGDDHIDSGDGSVGAADLERQLAIVEAAAAGPTAGILGPASVTWRVDREAAIFLGAGRALLLQLAHPWVAAAIAEHSRTLADPVGRFHRTFGICFTMVFGSLAQALAAARRLHRRHAAIAGRLPRAVGRFAAGTPYCANDIAALRWVHASLAETAPLAHALVFDPLTPQARELYWAESRRFAGLFGIPASALPRDWSGFAVYSAAMQQGDTLAVGEDARRIAAALFGGRLAPPLWYRAVTAGLLAPRWREEFGLSYGAAERRAAARALGVLRRVAPWLPPALRFAGPYREACARLAGRRPGLLVPLANRLWIGRARMPD